MRDRKLIWESKSEATAFEKSVVDTAERCNSLIETFESFQDWMKITTHAEWLELVTDPGTYFDTVLLANVNLSTGGRQVDPEALSKLVQIDRDSYLNLVAGKPVSDGCKPCQKMKLKRGSTAISLSGYLSDKDYLIFESGQFYLNTEAIEIKKESFKTYLENQNQVEYYQHYLNLGKILNDHIRIGNLGPIQIRELAKITGLLALNNTLLLNEIKLSETIKNIK